MMTEEEIRTAVHNCANKAGCEKCPYREHYGYLKDLECPECGRVGFIIETGEEISDED